MYHGDVGAAGHELADVVDEGGDGGGVVCGSGAVRRLAGGLQRHAPGGEHVVDACSPPTFESRP